MLNIADWLAAEAVGASIAALNATAMPVMSDLRNSVLWVFRFMAIPTLLSLEGAAYSCGVVCKERDHNYADHA
ncbi:hypothetical protein [Bifidobacterium sp. ESL0704]|uniref:hypothetical protein n=1 Tax=Bifidobacterium sp. ESL0704 TaxID=2983219 RepID=UPI0023F98012|nr:hypothetical protein [Bifidobacterium sp. ESL0704]WEV52860.1 hypothetical protein OZX64_08400 [Bifidobacterium sp. ESL0704]